MIDHYVMKAYRDKAWNKVRRILPDETSAQRGLRYVTNVIDVKSNYLLMMANGRRSEALGKFAAAMAEHGAESERIREIVMEIRPAYIGGAMEYFTGARVVLDGFHIMS